MANRIDIIDAQSVYTALMTDTDTKIEHSVPRLQYLFSRQALTADNIVSLFNAGKITQAEYEIIMG